MGPLWILNLSPFFLGGAGGRNIAKLRHWSNFLAKSPCFLKNESPNFAQFCFVCFFCWGRVSPQATHLNGPVQNRRQLKSKSALAGSPLLLHYKIGRKKKHRDSWWWGPKLHHLGTCDNKCRAMPKGVEVPIVGSIFELAIIGLKGQSNCTMMNHLVALLFWVEVLRHMVASPFKIFAHKLFNS